MPWWQDEEDPAPAQPVQQGVTRAELEADPNAGGPPPMDWQYPEDPFAPSANPEWGPPNTQTMPPLSGPLQRQEWGDTNWQPGPPDEPPMIGPPENPQYREAMAGRSYEPANMDWLQPARFPYSGDDVRSVQDAMTSNEPSKWLSALGLVKDRALQTGGELIHAGGNVLGTIGTGLTYEHQQIPQRMLGEMARDDAAGYGVRAAAKSIPGPWNDMGILGDLGGAMGKPDVQEVYKTQGPQAAFEYARDRYAPVPGLITENVVDPLNWIGGIGKGIVKGASEVGGLGGAALRGAGRVVNAVEAPYNAAMAAPFKAGKLAYEGAVDAGNAIIGGISDVAHAGPLGLRGEGVGARGAFNQALQDTENSIGAYRNAGYDWAQTVDPLAAVKARYAEMEAGKVVNPNSVKAKTAQLAGGIEDAVEGVTPDPLAWQGSKEATALQNTLWKDTRVQADALENPVNGFYALIAQQNASMIGNDIRAKASADIAALGAGATQEARDAILRASHEKQVAIISSVQEAINGLKGPAVDMPEEAVTAIQALQRQTSKEVEQIHRDFREGLDRIKQETGVKQVPLNVYQAGLKNRDEQAKSVLDAATEQAQRILYPAGVPDEFTIPGTALANRVHSEATAIADGRPIFANRVDEEHVQRWPQVQRLISASEQAIVDARTEARKVLDGQMILHPELEPLIEPVLRGEGTLADAVAVIRHNASTREDAADVATLKRLTDRWNQDGLDLLRSDNMELARVHIAGALASEHGYLGSFGGLPEKAAVIGRSLNGFVNFWKMQALASPRYIMQNAASQFGMNAIKGVPPGEMMSGLKSMTVDQLSTEPIVRVMDAARGAGRNPIEAYRALVNQAAVELEHAGPRGPKKVLDAMQQYQITPPSSVGEGGIGSMILDNPNAQVRWGDDQGKFLGREMPTWMESGLRALAGAAYGAPAGLEGAAMGAAWATTLPAQRNVISEISAILEGNARQLLWLKNVDEVANAAIEPFAQRLAEANLPTIAHAIKGTGGRLSIQTLEDMLARGDAPKEIVVPLVKDWATVLNEASKVGQKAVDETHFNYPVQDNIESFFRYTMPFMTWSKRAIPFFMDALAADPRLVVALHTLNAVQENQGEGEGKPKYLNAAMRLLPVGSQVADAIFGAQQKGGSTYFRPGQLMMPFSDATGDPTEGAQTPIAAGLGAMRAVGQSPAPWVDAGLRAVGALGDRPSDRELPGRILRPSSFIEAATGTNPETGWQRLAGMRGGVPPDQFSPPHAVDTTGDIDFLVKRRIQEGAIETFGRPLSDFKPWEVPPEMKPFQDAMLNPQSPIYQQALADVQRERGGSSIANWAAPLSMSPVRETSERIYADQQRAPGEAPVSWLRELFPQGPRSEQPMNELTRDRTGRLPANEQQIQALDAQAPPLARGYGGRAPVNPDELYAWAQHYDAMPARKFLSDSRNPEYNREGWLTTYIKWRGEQGLQGKVADPKAILAFLRHERPAS